MSTEEQIQTGGPDGRIYPFYSRSCEPGFVRSIIAECAEATRRRVNLSYMDFEEDVETWKQYSAAMTHFAMSSSEAVCALVRGDRQWVPGDLIDTMKMAHDMGCPFGGLTARKGFGAGWTCHWGNDDAKATEPLPIGTNDNRAYQVDWIDDAWIIIPRDVPGKLWEQLNFNGEELQHNLHVAMKDGDHMAVHNLVSLSLTESTVANHGSMVDFFRPMPLFMKDGHWAHLSGGFAFCERCKYCGIDPQINSHPVLVNWGKHGFTFHDAHASAALDRTTGPKDGND